MKGYSVTILDTYKELTPKEKVMMKDTSNCISIDEATENGCHLAITVENVVKLGVHNPYSKGDTEEYEKYVIVDKDGNKYVTGSTSLMSTLDGMFADMQGVEEEWAIDIYKKESKNFKGKGFITCSII